MTDSREKWRALGASFLGWMFDSFDMNLISIIVLPAVLALVGTGNRGIVPHAVGMVLFCNFLGWGIGGILFGILGDYVGRVRALTVSILFYTIFTGLAAFPISWQWLALCRFLAGLGIGGEWGNGTTLINEVWPGMSRSKAAGFMQSAYGFGFFLLSLINLWVTPHGWFWLFIIGVIPGLIVFFIRRSVHEPEAWVRVRRSARSLSLVQLFAPERSWRTWAGILAATVFNVAAWASLSFAPTWITATLTKAGVKNPSTYVSYMTLLYNVGAILGYWMVGFLIDKLGRRFMYGVMSLGAALVNILLFRGLTSVQVLINFAALWGFFNAGGFGVFTIYLPELFPTRLRTSGISLAFNVGKVLTAFGVLVGSALVAKFGGSYTAAITAMSPLFFIGVILAPLLPRTSGLPGVDSPEPKLTETA